VILWDDTWVRYHEPHIGRAAVRVLEALGFEVTLAEDRVCCGRPAASRGLLDDVRRAAEHNLPLLDGTEGPVVFLEPSCWSMFHDEYLQLGLPSAERVADRCILFEELVRSVLTEDAAALPVTVAIGEVAVHCHCHAEALSDPGLAAELLDLVPGITTRRLDTGCCGMAGAFGMLEDHRQLSLRVAAPLAASVTALPNGTEVVATGTSCRHQISDLTAARPLHVAELLAKVIGST
jgi:Fe-S oxidoreductase